MDGAWLRADAGQAAWSERFNELFAGVAGKFENAGSRKRARAYVLGLLSHTERKNGWTLAEFAGDRALGRPAFSGHLNWCYFMLRAAGSGTRPGPLAAGGRRSHVMNFSSDIGLR